MSRPAEILAALLVVGALVAPTAAAAAPLPVMAPQVASAERLAAWYETQEATPTLPVPVAELAALFVEEGAAEGVRGDVAFAQSVLETAYFTFPSSGQVRPGDHNYAGIGAVDGGDGGNRFRSPREGVRAQVQHLRAYADPDVTEADLAAPLVDPRFDLVEKGIAPHWDDLGGGLWASDPDYAEKVLRIWGRIAAFEEPAGAVPPPAPGTVVPPPLPGADDATSPGPGDDAPSPRASEAPAPAPAPGASEAPAAGPSEAPSPGPAPDPPGGDSEAGGAAGADGAERIAGADRYATAAAAAARGWPTGAATVHVVSGASWADALAAGPAAAADGAPLLLVRPDEVPRATADALAVLRPSEVVVHGGVAAVGDAVPTWIAAAAPGAEVRRLEGAERAATAAAVAIAGWPDGASTVVVASGADWVDALAAAPVAAAATAPLLLVGAGEVPPATAAALDALDPDRVVVAGGAALVGEQVLAQLAGGGAAVERVAGPDRWSTAAALAAEVGAGPGGAVFAAAGHTWPDALSAGPAAARSGAPLVLVAPDGVPAATAAAVLALDPAHAVLLGGTDVVSDAVLTELGAAAAR